MGLLFVHLVRLPSMHSSNFYELTDKSNRIMDELATFGPRPPEPLVIIYAVDKNSRLVFIIVSFLILLLCLGLLLNGLHLRYNGCPCRSHLAMDKSKSPSDAIGGAKRICCRSYSEFII